jgi:hypothetical protein
MDMKHLEKVIEDWDVEIMRILADKMETPLHLIVYSQQQSLLGYYV